MDSLIVQFAHDLENIERIFPDPEEMEGYVVENNGEPHVYQSEDEMKRDLIELARQRGHTVFFEVSLSSNRSANRGSKAFKEYNDALEFYRSVDTDSNERCSWDRKQIDAKILH